MVAGMAGVLLTAAAAAQSSEITKTLPSDRSSGQSEIRKSRPAPSPPAAAPERTPDRPERGAPAQAKSHRVVPAPDEDGLPDAKGQTVIVTQADVAGDAALTRFSLLMSARAPYMISKLANPYRIVVDLPDADFRLPAAAGQKGAGLVRTYRYGLFGPGKARVVIDTTKPVRIHKHAMSAHVHGGGKAVRLVLDLAPTDEESYLADVALGAAAHQDPRNGDDARVGTAKTENARPVVVIDPGHGGQDAGAIGSGFREKDVVLAVSHQVREALEATGRYEVHMTRSTDVFVTLPGRVAFSRNKGANLFVSIHANSVPTTSDNAAIVRGAAVYTLSEAASTREAQRLADKENAADLLADTPPEEINEVDRILTDLKWRETSEFSADFRARLLGHLKGAIMLSREPAPSAAFMVLRQGDRPSVLVELGYISNAKDVQLLVSPSWQRQVGRSIAAAVDEYFTSHERRR